ncbi:hypothetical protein KR059_004366, partial [Drosophila kikkawai]
CIAGLVLALSVPLLGDLLTRHTNIKCETKDKSYLEVKLCRLKVLGRGIIGANVHLKMLQLPIKSVTINYGVWKKLSGYHPFLFNVSVDFCHYLRHPNPGNVFHYFYRALMPYTNMNYTCPITSDLILKDFVLEDKMFSKFPVPSGSYMFSIKLLGGGVWKGSIYSYMDLNV